MKKKFLPAFRGLYLAFKHSSVWVQGIFGVLAIGLGLYLKLNQAEWLAFVFAIGFVIAAEIFNTACEKLCDRIQPEFDESIKDIKDLSAAAVLVSALTALYIAVYVIIVRI